MVWWWWIIPGFVAVVGLAIALSGIGWMFRRGKAPPPSAGRFSWLKKNREEANKKKADKAKAKQDAKKK